MQKEPGTPVSTNVPSVPFLHSVCPELALPVLGPQQHHTNKNTKGGGRPVCKYAMDPPAGIKDGAGRALDLRSRCLPGASRALPQSLSSVLSSTAQSPAIPGKDSWPSGDRRSELGSELLRP